MWHRNGIERNALGLSADQVKARFEAFAGERVTIANNEGDTNDAAIVARRREIEEGRLWLLKQEGEEKVISDKQNSLKTGQNSGFQAINLAILAGARRIVLLGFDMNATEKKVHWFGDHPIQTPVSNFSAWLPYFPKLAKAVKPLGVDIINCTPGSAIRCFPMRDLESVLSDPQPAGLPAGGV